MSFLELRAPNHYNNDMENVAKSFGSDWDLLWGHSPTNDAMKDKSFHVDLNLLETKVRRQLEVAAAWIPGKACLQE